MEFADTALTPPVDVVPEGTFFAGDYDPQRVAAIQRVITLGNEISGTHPEVADLYRNTSLTYLQIAEQTIPGEAVAFPEVASKAVGLAVRSLIPEEEQAEITARRRAERVKAQMQGLGEKQFREHQRAASNKRHELHGVDVAAMLEARGRTQWTEEERKLALELCKNQEFQHQTGSTKGRPNYANIAFALNELFHGENEIRYANSVGSMVRDINRKTK